MVLYTTAGSENQITLLALPEGPLACAFGQFQGFIDSGTFLVREDGRRREQEVGGARGDDAPDDLQPGVRNRVVDANANGDGEDGGDVDTVAVAVAPVRVIELRNDDPRSLQPEVVGQDDPRDRSGDVAEVD